MPWSIKRDSWGWQIQSYLDCENVTRPFFWPLSYPLWGRWAFRKNLSESTVTAFCWAQPRHLIKKLIKHGGGSSLMHQTCYSAMVFTALLCFDWCAYDFWVLQKNLRFFCLQMYMSHAVTLIPSRQCSLTFYNGQGKVWPLTQNKSQNIIDPRFLTFQLCKLKSKGSPLTWRGSCFSRLRIPDLITTSIRLMLLLLAVLLQLLIQTIPLFFWQIFQYALICAKMHKL